jgi:arylsulfatase A-like enzyme
VAGGQAFNQPVFGLDIMPTVVRASGFTLPSKRANDGGDMLAALDGKRRAEMMRALRYADRPCIASAEDSR